MTGGRRKLLEDWIDSYLRARSPLDVDPILAALSAYGRVETNVDASTHDLQEIVAISTSRRKARLSVGCDMLRDLTRTHQAAREAVIAMSESSHAGVRFNALVALGPETPTDLVDALVIRGLCDRSVRVRAKAADRSLWLRARWLAPKLAEAVHCEGHAATRVNLELCRALLADGFVVSRESSGRAWVTALDSTGLVSAWFEAGRSQAGAIEAFVADARELARRECDLTASPSSS
ncbi:MAG: hypothetical protein FJ091_19455 [Deltaproteobacteria bacterium]|nr:hypothetical protein [Deltaproteobacteria bacterium]